MTNAQKAKGDRWERACVEFLRSAGLEVERAYGAGRPDDVGDIDGISWLAVSCKDHQTLRFSQWLDEVQEQAVAARKGHAVVIAKCARRATGDAYAVMRLRDFADLVAEFEE